MFEVKVAINIVIKASNMMLARKLAILIVGMIIIKQANLLKCQSVVTIITICLRDYSSLILIHHFPSTNHQYCHVINLFHYD